MDARDARPASERLPILFESINPECEQSYRDARARASKIAYEYIQMYDFFDFKRQHGAVVFEGVRVPRCCNYTSPFTHAYAFNPSRQNTLATFDASTAYCLEDDEDGSCVVASAFVLSDISPLGPT